MNPDLTEIADKVRGVAGEKRVSQGDIARMLGLSRQAVNLRMNGKIPFAAWEIKRLSRELRVPIVIFFGAAFADERVAS